MNTRLVDSLIQIIEPLTPEERIFLQEQLSNKPIQVTAGVCGGQPLSERLLKMKQALYFYFLGWNLAVTTYLRR